MRKLLAIATILVFVGVLFASFPALFPETKAVVIEVQALAETCPATGDWVKIEPLSGLSYTYTAPEGQLIAESCYKVGSHSPVFQTYDPALGSVTVVSTVFNSPGGAICTAPGVPEAGCAYQALSHASFRLIDDPGTETPTETPPTETPPTETPPTDTPTPTVTPTPPEETETPVVEVEVNTGGSLLPAALILIGLTGVAGFKLIGRRKK